MDFASAIDAHVDWKTKLRSAIAAQAELDANAIRRDHVCPLGQWLHGEGRAKYGRLSGYRACVGAHAAFHREAGRVAHLINSRRYAEADAALAPGTPYSMASSAMGVAINKLSRELEAKVVA